MKRNSIGLKLRYSVFKRDNFKCVCCGSEFVKDLEVDHIMPVSKGGSNSLDNLQTLCNECNSKKRNYKYQELYEKDKLNYTDDTTSQLTEKVKNYYLGLNIKQKNINDTIFYSATDLVKITNRYRVLKDMYPFNLSQWFSQETTKEFINALNLKFGNCIIRGRGRNSNTWVHPYLFIDIAITSNPELKIETYEWLYNHVLRYKDTSGDSFKKMSGALWDKCPNKREFQNYIKSVSRDIKSACGIEYWDDWQKADADTLLKRDKMHENIALLADILPLNEAVRIGILKSK
jgi:hypothetical protein